MVTKDFLNNTEKILMKFKLFLNYFGTNEQLIFHVF